MHDLPIWIQNFQWKWIYPDEIFKFLSIPFNFQAHPIQLWSYVVQKMETKLEY